MKGKICMVTGGTSGIGLVTAQSLALLGATVIVVARNPSKGTRAIARIQQETGNPHVEFLLADLSVQAQVRQLAATFKNRYGRLDVLVNNAGAIFLRRQLSLDGIEMTLAVNHLSVFLLTNLLLDVLKESAPSRVVNVSSESHRSAEIELDDLQRVRRYRGLSVYGQSKLAMLLFNYELARRLAGTGVTVNALHPGFVATDIGQNNGWFMKLAKPVIKLVGMSPKRGAETSIYLASSPEVEDVTGKYFEKRSAVSSAPASYDEVMAQRLWETSTVLTGL